MQTLDLEQFKYSGTNITAFRLVDPDNRMVRTAVTEWSQSELKTIKKSTQFVAHQNDSVVNAETALMYDAVHLFAKALHDLDTSQQIDIQPLSCDGQDTWPHGYSLINYMKIVTVHTRRESRSECNLTVWCFQVELKGLTNLIKFDNQGFRTDFVLDIIELSQGGFRKIGDWNSTQGVNFTRSFGEKQTEIVENLKNKTLVITMILVSATFEGGGETCSC